MQTLPSPEWTCTRCWSHHNGEHSWEQCDRQLNALLSPHNENLLTYARVIYRTMGVLPLHVATELMEAGFIVSELEAQWDQEFAQ